MRQHTQNTEHSHLLSTDLVRGKPFNRMQWAVHPLHNGDHLSSLFQVLAANSHGHLHKKAQGTRLPDSVPGVMVVRTSSKDEGREEAGACAMRRWKSEPALLPLPMNSVMRLCGLFPVCQAHPNNLTTHNLAAATTASFLPHIHSTHRECSPKNLTHDGSIPHIHMLS